MDLEFIRNLIIAAYNNDYYYYCLIIYNYCIAYFYFV